MFKNLKEISRLNPKQVASYSSFSSPLSRLLPSPLISPTSSHHFQRSLRRLSVTRPQAPIAAARNTAAALDIVQSTNHRLNPRTHETVNPPMKPCNRTHCKPIGLGSEN
ncbi:hypothetical protein LXL04_024868 [Taraxacum kok-saghyz]